MRRDLRRYVRSLDSTVHRWQAERALWAAMVPVAIMTGWIYSVAFVSAVSIWTAYQSATTNYQQAQKRREDAS